MNYELSFSSLYILNTGSAGAGAGAGAIAAMAGWWSRAGGRRRCRPRHRRRPAPLRPMPRRHAADADTQSLPATIVCHITV